VPIQRSPFGISASARTTSRRMAGVLVRSKTVKLMPSKRASPACVPSHR